MLQLDIRAGVIEVVNITRRVNHEFKVTCGIAYEYPPVRMPIFHAGDIRGTGGETACSVSVG